jgi:hypothetical protein
MGSFPRYLLQPGQEGYRTPMLEDVEKEGWIQSNGEDSTAVLRRLQSRAPEGLGDDGESQKKPTNINLRLMDRLRHFTWT